MTPKANKETKLLNTKTEQMDNQVDFAGLHLEFFLQPERTLEEFQDLKDVVNVEFTTITKNQEREVFIVCSVTPVYKTMVDKWQNVYLKSVKSYNINISAVEDYHTLNELQATDEDVLEQLIRTKLDELLEM